MELKEYLEQGVSPYHVVKTAKERLQAMGFRELQTGDMEVPEAGKGYFISPYDSAFFAFRVNPEKQGMRIALAHTDSPSFLVKPNPEMPEKPYLRINVEPYGGMLKRTWFDRPLGIAGRVILKNEADAFSPKEMYFDSESPWFVIPSLAPHLDHGIETEKIDEQKCLIPLYGIGEKESISFLGKIAEKLSVKEEDILTYSLYLYNTDPAEKVGVQEDFLLAPRIDNIASVAALTEALIHTEMPEVCLDLIACFDNEEIGSRSKQGADSELLKLVIEDLYRRMGKTEQIISEYKDSMMLSVDGAHAVHPNFKEKSDVTAQVVPGGGVVLKSSASQRYVTDSKASAIIKGLCEKHKIPVQEQANRSGAPGGQTLGPIASSYLPVLAADIGIPMLAMHSARELAAGKDYDALYRLMTVFFG